MCFAPSETIKGDLEMIRAMNAGEDRTGTLHVCLYVECMCWCVVHDTAYATKPCSKSIFARHFSTLSVQVIPWHVSWMWRQVLY